MKIKEFTYTKPNGEVSRRTLVELVSPTEHFEGVDISELDADSFVEFTTKMQQLEAEIYAKRMALYAEFDLSKSYRRFTPSRMADITVEYV